MANKEVGKQARLPGKLDGIGFDVFAMKEPVYTMIFMSTYGQLVVSYGQKENVRMVDVLNANGTGTRKQVHFKYTKILSDHYNFREAVDKKKKHHGGKCGHGMSLKNTWSTKI